MDGMITQVFNALKKDSRKGDFVFLSNNDKMEQEIDKTDEEFTDMRKYS